MKCPKCNCEDIAISVGYRKSTIYRILRFLIIVAIFATIVLNMAEVIRYNELEKFSNMSSYMQATFTSYNPDNIPDGYYGLNPTGPILLGLTTALILVEIVRIIIESKKRIYYVCKQCNEIWDIEEEILK